MTVFRENYVDELCAEGCGGGTLTGEDSSYDSDYEVDGTTGSGQLENDGRKHQDVSRTASDTLAAEFAEYVNSTDNTNLPDATNCPGYTARVEFALKLGYTEKLVQTALSKLGPAPTQNELLAELIKLGAQRTPTTTSTNDIQLSCTTSPISIDSSVHHDSVQPVLDDDTNVDSCHHHLSQTVSVTSHLRDIVIDGSNVAMSHGNKKVFSCRGIKLCVDWFRRRGHNAITVFVPKWRKESPRCDNPITDQEILSELENDGMLAFTPSRLFGGKRTVCYDDRYILRLAAESDGIVVSNDNYRDLCQENAIFRRVVEERILMYTFVNDRFMPPDDPLGRTGPTLENFLRREPKKNEQPPPPNCPYGKKCTYGNKCKYHHPERGPHPHKSVTERLSEHAQRHLLAREVENKKTPLGRTRSVVTKDISHHCAVAKSHSVDAVTGGAISSQQPQTTIPVEKPHKKLQRTLTLNPSAILIDQQQQRILTNTSHFMGAQAHHYITPPPPPHMTNWNLQMQHHEHVTRIASAPDSYRPTWQQQQQQTTINNSSVFGQQMANSCSDTQLNAQWPLVSSVTTTSTSSANCQNEDIRRKLHYHLSAIFPEGQVRDVMQLLPNETNPQKICAAILSMFPKT